MKYFIVILFVIIGLTFELNSAYWIIGTIVIYVKDICDIMTDEIENG